MRSNDPNTLIKRIGTYLITILIFAFTGCGEDDTTIDPLECECSQVCMDICTGDLLEDLQISTGGFTRTYDVYLPPLHQISDDLPILIDIHGFTSNTADQRAISDFIDLADEENFVIVWPLAKESGTNCLLNGPSGLYWNADWGVEADDIGFIDDLINEIGSDYNVDLTRVYVTGLSNGGFMTYSIACALSDRIAAVASVAGSMTEQLLTTTCQPSRQVPVLHVHGTDDQIIFLDGEPNCKGGIAAIEDVVDFWRTNAGCSNTSTESEYENLDTNDNSTAKIITYDNCGSIVQFLLIEGGGHNWPGSQEMIANSGTILQPINNDINASEIIWNFLKDHQL